MSDRFRDYLHIEELREDHLRVISAFGAATSVKEADATAVSVTVADWTGTSARTADKRADGLFDAINR